jgi:hypothetical protein
MDFPFITAAPVFDGDMSAKGGWSPDELAGFVESLIERFPVDRNRVYLTGFSMGGMAVNRLAAHRPDLFAAVAPLCGYGDPEWAKAMAPLPVYFYHGDADTAVSCYSSLVIFKALEALGGNPSLKIYHDVGHPVWNVTYRETDFYKKLLSHQRLAALGHATIGADQGITKGSQLELIEGLPKLNHPYVCWIDQAFAAGDLFKGRSMRGKTVAPLERLYPSLPVTGNILVAFPEGLTSETSTMRMGIALESPVEVPPGFVVEALQADGPGAILRSCTKIDELARAADQYQVLASAVGILRQPGWKPLLDP